MTTAKRNDVLKMVGVLAAGVAVGWFVLPWAFATMKAKSAAATPAPAVVK